MANINITPEFVSEQCNTIATSCAQYNDFSVYGFDLLHPCILKCMMLFMAMVLIYRIYTCFNVNKKITNQIGIIAIQSYIPKFYVSQSAFEGFNNVSSGMYTNGCGQEKMSFVTDLEDICSISMTVFKNLMSKNNIRYDEIGWVCVATETIIDHSKSISSMLMQVFEENECSNVDIEGVDVKHACYAGTAALFNAFNRISSEHWDGKYCVVITADIAEYEPGDARFTGGCGAIALLLGKNGCIGLDKVRASYKANQNDFYKPNLNSPYPVVNGALSKQCYMDALDSCYNTFKTKFKLHHPNVNYTAFLSDYWVFHAPYNKLVKRAFGRVIYNDFRSGNSALYYKYYKDDPEVMEFLREQETAPPSNGSNVIKGFENIAKPWYEARVKPSTLVPKQVGNCYTASIFMGLLSLICNVDIEKDLCGKTVAMFSYGSGTIASLYGLNIQDGCNAVKQLKKIVANNDIKDRLKQRVAIDCGVFTQIVNRKATPVSVVDANDVFMPSTVVNQNTLFPNTYHLTEINAQKQRSYELYEQPSNSMINENARD